MSAPTAPPTGKARLSLQINDKTYTVRRLSPHPAVALIAWRLTRKDGPDSEAYDVHEDGFGLHCDCPDFNYRREPHGQLCKHCLALQAVGLVGRE